MYVHAHICDHLADVIIDLYLRVTCWPEADVRSADRHGRVVLRIPIDLGRVEFW